jgi:hypothetical protein
MGGFEPIGGHGNLNYHVFMDLGQLIGFHDHIGTGGAQNFGTDRGLDDFADLPDLFVKRGNIPDPGLGVQRWIGRDAVDQAQFMSFFNFIEICGINKEFHCWLLIYALAGQDNYLRNFLRQPSEQKK